MNTCQLVEEVRSWSRAQHQAGQRIAFVPTLGCLHEGHASLLRRARAENDRVALSVFVNPFQFPSDKYAGYPRRLAADLELAAREGVDLAFVPEVDEMYPGTPSLDALYALQQAEQPVRDDEQFVAGQPFGAAGLRHIRVPRRLVERMDGNQFPWHFDGVASVVARLFEIVEPDVAYFGEKDPQQLAILTRLNAWLPRTVEIRPVPIVREADGMPSSSRNTLLTPEQRRMAATPSAALAHGDELLCAGTSAVAELLRAMREIVAREPGVTLDYLGVVDPLTLEPTQTVRGPALLFVSFFVGGVRLTDSRYFRPTEAART